MVQLLLMQGMDSSVFSAKSEFGRCASDFPTSDTKQAKIRLGGQNEAQALIIGIIGLCRHHLSSDKYQFFRYKI